MKGVLLFTLVLCFVYIKCIMGAEITNRKLTTYLNKKSEAVQDTILEKLKEEIGYFGVEEETTSEIINGGYRCMFTLFNEIFIMMDNEIYHVKIHDGTINLRKIIELESRGTITFTRVTEFEHVGYILIKTEMDVDIYGYQSNEIFHMQSIFAPYATDAHFFVNHDALHLVLIKNRGDDLAVSILYKWLGTYFDEIDLVFTTGAIQVKSFKNNFFEIIVILQHSTKKKLLSAIYEFNFGKIKKIQHIEVSDPSNLDVVQTKTGTYVLVFEKSKNNVVYAWSGSKLVKISEFQTAVVVNKSVAIESNNSFSVIVPLNDKLQMFHLFSNEMKLVGEKIFKWDNPISLDIHKKNTNDAVYVVGVNKNHTLYMGVISFKGHLSDVGSHEKYKDSLRNCFHTLENTVYSKKNKMKQSKGILSQVKVDPDQSTSTDKTETDSGSESNLNKLRMKLNDLQDVLKDYEEHLNNTTINKKVILKGSIEAEKVACKNMILKVINGRNWTPQNWLKYKEPQTITGPTKIGKIKAVQLNTAPSDLLFTELLTKHGDLDIQGDLKVANLTANKILAKIINDVQLNHIYLKSKPQPIQGLKTFENIHTPKAKINTINEQPVGNFLSQLVTDSTNVIYNNLLEVENLVVDTINDIQWNTFRDSVFRIGITKEINGDLTLPEFDVNSITLKTLKGIKVESLLTTSTDQIIEADVEFGKIFVKNITTNTTNDIQLSKSAVQSGNDTLVEGPVKFDKLYVENIELIGELDKEFFLWNGDHIKGTNESDLWQTYEEVIKIKGNLYVKNLTLKPNATLFIAGEEFDPDIRNIYWTKNTTQSIPTHFKAHNGLSVRNLHLNELNDIEFNQYMLNKDGNRFETRYHFKNVTVLGNILLDHKANHTPNLAKLNEEAIKTTGSYHIQGNKIYTDMLRVENVETAILDGVKVKDILTTDSVVNVRGKKTFKNIIIKGNLFCDMQFVDFINNVNITNLLDTAIYIDKPQNIEKLHFKNVTVKELWATELNNHHVYSHIQNIQKILSSNKIDILTVNGKVELDKVTDVSKINGIKFEKLKNAWKQGKSGGILINIEFLEPVKIGNLLAVHINTLNLRHITKRFLYRSLEQNVTALYSFENVKADNLVVSKINDVSMNNLIDVSTTAPQTIYAPDGIEFGPVILQRSLNASKTSPCNLVESLKKIRDPPTTNWDVVNVKGNATFLDPDSTLYRVFEKAVTDNTETIIQAPVEFTNHILAANVITTGSINGINLTEIIDDAVLAESEEEQIITGSKLFPTLKISEATVMKDTDVPEVNKIDIPVLNERIVRNDGNDNHIITGEKTFYGGLQCDNFYSKEVSNIDTDNIVTTEKLRKIPKVAFEFVNVENNLNISYINNFDFDGFLKTRLLTEGVDQQTVDGLYYFDNIQAEDMRVPLINNITMDNVVFDIGQQNITASKHFTQTLEIFGNLTCPYINNINVSDLYKKSLGEDGAVKGSLTVLRPSVVKGNITTEYINGYPVKQVKEILNQGTIKSEIEKIRHIRTDITERIKRNIEHIKFLASDYMYIEKSQALQILVPNTISAKTMEYEDYVLIHVNGEEPGQNCGLPENCKCPVQYSIEISPEQSVAIFPNKGTQRIFTYDDDEMIIHFLTNSFSKDNNCRSEAKASKEVSVLSWNTKGNVTSSFHHHKKPVTGYISGAEFFTFNGHAYAIIGRYYNHITDSHDLDCYLIKLSHDKSKAKEIQEIPTRGAWSIYLFHTAQGVTLIIGNIKKTNYTHQEEEMTTIYRFNGRTEKFDLLRIVRSYGCSMATGVVLDTDSLIVLAHRYAPPRVLKYNLDFDNYYFYQSFELEAPVVGISVFYTGGFGISDAYLCTVTENDNYFIYSFRFIEGWKLESSGELEGLKNLIPFKLNKQLYLFAPSSKISSLLTVVKHGSV